MNMSWVSWGRLLMLTWNVMLPASSFDTTTLVTSGALAFSPTESAKDWLLLVERAEPPSAAGTPTRSAASTMRTPTRVFTADRLAATHFERRAQVADRSRERQGSSP